MYANVNLISHTKLVCENFVFSESCCLENKCDVGKLFSLNCKAIGQFGYLKIGIMLPKYVSSLAVL
jgi:hypothetical protein